MTGPRLRVMGVRRMNRVLAAWGWIAARATRARADDRNRGSEHTPQQRQENDGEIHRQPFIRLMSSTAIDPRLR